MAKSINSKVNIINANVGENILQVLNGPKKNQTIPDENPPQKEIRLSQPCSSSFSESSKSSKTPSEQSNSQRNQKSSFSQQCSTQIQPNQIPPQDAPPVQQHFTPSIFLGNNQNQNPYENRNFSQIRHKGIYRVDQKIFHISTGCCIKSIPIIFFIFAFILFLPPVVTFKMYSSFIAT